MSLETGAEGIAYTETTVYSVPEAYVKDAPYQLAILELVPAYGNSRPPWKGSRAHRRLAKDERRATTCVVSILEAA